METPGNSHKNRSPFPLGIYLKEINSSHARNYMHQDGYCSGILVVKNWKQSECPLTGIQITYLCPEEKATGKSGSLPQNALHTGTKRGSQSHDSLVQVTSFREWNG